MRRFLNIAVGLLALLSLTASTYVRDWFDIEDYGARPEVWTSATKNVTVINQCISAAYSNGGGTVYIPGGHWYINAPLTLLSNVSIQGTGTNTSKIVLLADTCAFNNDPEDSLRNWVIRDIAVHGLAASCQDSSNQHGLALRLEDTGVWHDGSFWELRNVDFRWLGGHAIWLYAAPDTCNGLWNCTYWNEGLLHKVMTRNIHGHALLLEGKIIDIHCTDSFFQTTLGESNYRFSVLLDNDTTGADPDTFRYVPAVCLMDTCVAGSSTDWGRATGIQFARCALQTTYFDTSAAPYKEVGICVYARNPHKNLAFADCWFEVGSNQVPFRAIYADTSRCTYLSDASFFLRNSSLANFSQVSKIVEIQGLWDAVVVEGNEWQNESSGRKIVLGGYEPAEKLTYPGWFYFDQSESTFIFWNGARWDTVTTEQRP